MRWRRLILICFVEAFATTCVQRGMYFYAQEALAFSKAMNLWLALTFGATYVAGALLSHRLAERAGERRLLMLAVAGQVVVYAGLAARAGAGAIFAGAGALGLVNGLKWPVVESYVGAGRDLSSAARAIGRFNVAWASAVPLSVALAGPIIGHWPRGLFLLSGTLGLLSLGLMASLPARPAHLPADHPRRPPAERIARLRRLVVSSRWLLLVSYSCLWIMAAVMPQVFASLGHRVEAGAALSAPVDVVRVAMFFLMGLTARWHGRRGPIVLGMAAMPLGFGMVVSGHSTALVLAGEVVFGVGAAIVYYAHLYYVIVVENASVGAGASHEGLIGLGFATGPVAGLAGVALAGVFGGELPGMIAGIAPLVLLCTFASARALHRAGGEG